MGRLYLVHEVMAMHYADLSNYAYYLKKPVDSVRNVGWLDAAYEFDVGAVPDGFLEKLEAIICSIGSLNAHVNKIRGVHSCSVCGELGPFEIGSNNVVLGASELWIPDVESGLYWAAPSLIYHYVRDHGYRPPDEFIKAVMAMNLESGFNAQDVYLDLVAGHF
jgi:hypothetical protein